MYYLYTSLYDSELTDESFSVGPVCSM